MLSARESERSEDGAPTVRPSGTLARAALIRSPLRMSILDDIFNPAFFFDSEYLQRRDIQLLAAQISDTPSHSQVQAVAARVDQLELLCSALVELLVAKGVTTSAELRVLMQQVDLSDGVEDGRVSKNAREQSPRCACCQRFLNPAREACVYCGTPMAQAVPQPPAPKPRPEVTCTECRRTVPESDTYFSGRGLLCSSCYAQSPE